MDEEIFKVYMVCKACNQYTKIPNIWEISNYGRVKRNGEIYECKTHGGYLIFSNHFLHRAVAELFIPNPNNYNEVDHIDGNKLNNHYSNLRWCTHKENMLNPITRKQLSEMQKGEKSHWYGKCHSDETKKKISEGNKGKHSGEKSPMYGKKSTFFGKKHSEESKNKLSNAFKGRHVVLCEDGKRHWV